MGTQGEVDRAREFLLGADDMQAADLAVSSVIDALCGLVSNEQRLAVALGCLFDELDLLEELLGSDTSKLSTALSALSAPAAGSGAEARLRTQLLQRAPELPIRWMDLEPCVHWLRAPSLLRCLLAWAHDRDGAAAGLKRRFRPRVVAEHTPHYPFEEFDDILRPGVECHCDALARDASAQLQTADLVEMIAASCSNSYEAVELINTLPTPIAAEVVAAWQELRQQIVRAFAEDSGREYYADKRLRALRLLPVADLDQEAAGIGRFLARQIDSDADREADTVAELLGRPVDEVAATLTCDVALLWLRLQALTAYDRDRWNQRDESAAVTADLLKSIESAPHAWTLSIELLLGDGDLPASIGELLAVACLRSKEVVEAIERVRSDNPRQALRDKAHGALLGLADPLADNTAVDRWLADLLARRIDKRLPFPRAMTALAGTWLGSRDVEDALAQGVKRAQIDMANTIRALGVMEEEHLTGRLLVNLEHAFQDLKPRLALAENGAIAVAVQLDHRPVPKTVERRWGCDLALVLDADLPGQMSLALATLIQVKKSGALAESGHSKRESWTIAREQLDDLQQRTDAAFYWLLLSSGEVACVPARILNGIAAARALPAEQRTFVVGYREIRHAAIPLDQFVPELVTGTWVGTHRPDVVSFARGEHSRIEPQRIFTISLRGRGDDVRGRDGITD